LDHIYEWNHVLLITYLKRYQSEIYKNNIIYKIIKYIYNGNEFIHKANAFHKTITFTSEISNENHVFLDTVSCIEGSQLVTDLYSKPSDSPQYLLPTSCHPRHCCKNIPCSLALRIRRICSQEADYERRTHKLSSHLCRIGYKSENVDKAIAKAGSIQIHELLIYKSKVTQSRIPFVVTYHPGLPKKKDIIDKHWQTIETNIKLNRIFPEKPMIAF